MSLSRAKKISLIAAGLILLSLVLLFVFKDSIIQQIAVHTTSASRLKIQTLEIERFGLNELIVRRFRAVRPEEARETTIDFENVRIQFSSWMDLPGSIQTLSVDDAFVQMDVKSGVKHEREKDGEEVSSTLGLGEWSELLTSVDVDINRLELVYSEDYKTLLFELIGSLHNQDTQWILDSRVGVLESFLGKLDVKLHVDGQYHVDLQGLDKELSIINVDGRWLAIDQGIQLSGLAKLHFGLIKDLLESRSSELIFWNIEDKTEVKFDLQLPFLSSSEENLLAGSVRIRSSGDILHKSWGSARYRGELSCQLQGLFLQSCTIPAGLYAKHAAGGTPKDGKNYYQSISVDLAPAESFLVKLDWQKKSVEVIGDLQLKGLAKGPDAQFDAHLNNIISRYASNEFYTSGNYQLKADLAAVNEPVMLKQLQATSQGDLSWKDGIAQLTANQGSVFSFAKLKMDAVELENARFELLNPLIWEGTPAEWHIQPAKISAAVAKVLNNGELLLTPSKGEVALSSITNSNSQLDGTLDFDWNEVKVHTPKITIPLQNLSGNLVLRGKQVHSRGGVYVGTHKDKVIYETSFNTKSGDGALQVSCSELSFKQNQILNRVIASTGYPMVLKQGTVQFALRNRWKGNSQLTQNNLDLTVRGASGTYAQLPFEGLSVQASFDGDGQWRLREATKIALNKAFLGVPVENVHIDIASLTLNSDNNVFISVPALGADVLGGSIFAKNTEFDSSRDTNTILLKLSNLSLEELLKYQKTKDLYLSGFLVGELPISYSNGVFTIDDGNLTASEGGGVIRYLNLDHLKSAKADLSIVSDMLKNFHYQSLTANASLAPDGEVLLKTHLQGKNPDLEHAEVNLNFNIEFNLPSALKTAKLLYFVDKDIEEYVRSRSKQ